MKEKKNIDRLFQEKFKNFEAHPSDRVWDNIVLAQKKKDNRKIIPLWWKVGGIAAALLLLFGLATILIPSNDNVNMELVEESNVTGDSSINQNNTNGVASQESNTPDEDEVTLSSDSVVSSSTVQYSTTQNSVDLGNVVSTSSNTSSKTNEAINNAAENKNPKQRNIQTNNNGLITYQETVQSDNRSSNSNQGENKNKTSASEVKGNTTIVKDNTEGIAQITTPVDQQNEKKDLVAEAQKIDASQEEDVAVQVAGDPLRNRWDVGAIAAPVYYGDFGGSGLDKQFADNNKSGDVNLSYGVQVSYAVTPKLKIRTGVSTVDLSYNTNDISYNTNGLGRRLRGVNYSENARTFAISDNTSSSENSFSADGIVPRNGFTSEGSLEQQLSYLEIPVEAVYVISDKRIGLSLVGGVSTLLLNNNNVILKSTELTTSLGTASGVNDVSFSTNIGVGLDYKITDKVIFNVEPSLKYQLNSFDNTVVDFKPYFLGVYTGISYKF